MEKEVNNKILGTEKISKLLRMFAIPCVLSLIIQSLYNVVDQIFIGNCASLGQYGNTATGIIYPLTVIALAIGLALGDGSAASISLNQGRNDTKITHKSIGTALSIGTIVSVIFMIACFMLKSNIIKYFGSSEAIFSYASEYANWIIVGFPFFILTCIMNPIIRADGSPRYSMISMTVGAIINMILDPIFLFKFNTGMNGAALATFIGQVISFLISAIYFFNAKTFKLTLRSFIPKIDLLKTSFKLGVSSFLTQLSIVIISIVNNNVLLKYMPTDVSAIGLLNIAFKVFGIVLSIIIGVSCGGQPIVGYNYGAKNYERVKETYKYIISISIIVGIISTIIFELCPGFIFKLFGYTNVSDFGYNIFRIYLSFFTFTCLTKATSIFFQSVEEPVKATILTIFRDAILLVPLTIILPMIGGINSFLLSAPISDAITFIIMIIFIIPFMKKLKVNSKENNIENVTIKKSHEGIIITISREHGSGGREIAMKLAKELNIPFYDKEICSLLAKDSGISPTYIDNIENTNLYSSFVINQDIIKEQTELLNRIADNGACIILGRAADYILRDYSLCKVFIYASDDYKVKRVMKNYKDKRKDAQNNIEKSDKRRAKFYEDLSGRKWGESKNYNLCIDSSIGINKCTEIITKYYENIN